MRRSHGTRDAVMAGHGQPLQVRFVQRRIGGNHADGGVQLRHRAFELSKRLGVHGWFGRVAVEQPGLRINHRPNRVGHDERGHGVLPNFLLRNAEAAAQHTCGCAAARTHAAGNPATGQVALLALQGSAHRRRTISSYGAVRGIAHHQIKNHRRRHDRHHRSVGYLITKHPETPPVLF